MGKHDHPVSVIIPAWNNWTLTRPCLESLAANTPEIPLQVVLVDNGSTDATPKDAPSLGRALFGERFVFVRLEGNLGFARACNQGAWNSSADYLFFLNNDTTVEPGWLPPLIRELEADRRLAGVGPLLLFPEDGGPRSGRVQHLGITVTPGPEFRHLYEMFPADHPAVRRRKRLSVLTAAAFLVRANLFAAEGGFFEGFVNGMEDVDLCCRIGAKGGYFTVVPDSVVHHHTNKTPGRFEREQENFTLLRRRCRDVVEDYGAMLAADGFEPAFTPWLELIATLPAARCEELERSYQEQPTMEHLRSLIRQEPLWDAGYAYLTREAAALGNASEAIPAAYLRTVLCPGLESYQEYKNILFRVDQSGLAAKTESLLAAIRKFMSDPVGLARRAADIGRSTREPSIMAALELWRKGSPAGAD